MADRSSQRARRQIPEDSTESSGEEKSGSSWSLQIPKKAQTGSTAATVPSATNNMSRPRRGAAVPAIANTNHSSSVIVSRSPSNSPEECRRSIKLTVKMPSSKLREVTSQSTFGRSIAVNSRDTFEAGEIMTGKRSTRTRATTKLKCYNESDDPDDWDESEESEDEVEVEANSPVEARSTTEEDDEDEDEDEDEEDEVDVATPLAPSKQVPSRPTARPTSQQIPRPQTKSLAKPALVITPAAAAGGPIKSVEEKQMEMENDEAEELSELDSNGEEEEQDERNMDAEGEEDDIGAEEDAEGDEDVDAEGDMESDVGTPGSGMGSPKAQTKRQRGQDEGAFLALPMEPQIKKVLTADEHRMRRAEMARRRKNLSEKRNEEEKMSTINRLLKRQVPKRRGKAMNPETLEAATAAEGASPAEAEEIEMEKANPLFVRWINNKDGSRIGVPEEWLGKKAGRLFGPATRMGSKLVEEIA